MIGLDTIQVIVKANMATRRPQGVLKVTTGQGGNKEPRQWEAGGKRHQTTAHAGCLNQENKPSSAPTYTALGINKKSFLRAQEEQIAVQLGQFKEVHKKCKA